MTTSLKFRKYFLTMFSATLTFISIMVFADGPVELPPITVTAHYDDWSMRICGPNDVLTCSGLLGETVTLEMASDILPEDGDGGIGSNFLDVIAKDVEDNVNNDEPGAECNSEAEIKEKHARSDIGVQILRLNIGDFVRIVYDNGQSEIFFIECRICTLPAKIVPNTCQNP